mgnify:CR=1 FL=1
MPRKRATTKTKKTKPKRIARKKNVVTPAHPKWMVRVSRFNPLMDYVSRTHEYVVTPHEGESVLDLLYRLKHTQDGSLTFRGSCGYGGCGTCGMRVNGKPIMACTTQVNDVLDSQKNVRIDPLHGNVLKDLVVDEGPFFAELMNVKPWLYPRKNDEKRRHKMGPNDVRALGKTPLCMLCGLCNAHVESEKKGELGPAALVKAYRYVHDARDGNAFRLGELSPKLNVHYSLDQANLCPRDIQPGKRIGELRQESGQKLKKTTKQREKKTRVWKE